MRYSLFLLPVLLLTVFTSTLKAITINVPGDEPTIQAGINACVDGDTVLVADGTYTGDGNRDIDFGGRAIMVMSENGPEVTIIDCEGSEVDQHRGFYFRFGEDLSSVVQGFTIKNGYAPYGGGICCYMSSPTITGNIIVENSSTGNGGGIMCHTSSSPTISNNIITGNRANNDGGGINCANSYPIITNNTIIGNWAVSHGGGIHGVGRAVPIITNSIFWGNNASIGQEIAVRANSSFTVSHSDVEGGQESVFVDPNCVLHWDSSVFDTDPLILDPGNRDYHLSTESPCIDAGVDAGVYNDFEGDLRPVGFGFDIGADESPYSVACNLALSATGPLTVGSGGSLYFSMLMQNNTDNQITGDFWLSVLLPNSSEIEIPENFLNHSNPLHGQIFPNSYLELSNQLFVPTMADTGSYQLIGRIGNYPDGIVDEESFEFRVIGDVSWRQLGFNAQRTSYNPYEQQIGPSNVGDLGVSWTHGFSSSIRGGVSVVDGIAYYGTYGGTAYASDEATGARIWTRSLQGKHQGQAVVDGVAYVNSYDMAYAFDASTGGTIWTWDPGARHLGGPVVADGVVYVPPTGSIQALDADTGDELWSISPGGGSAVADGVVYISNAGTLRALNSENGELLWTGFIDEGNLTRPVATNGVIYMHSDVGYLYVFDANGCGQDSCTPLWAGVTEVLQQGDGPQAPAVAEGKVYVGSNDTFYAFDANGCGEPQCSPLYTTNTAVSFFSSSSPSVANGVVYSTCGNNYIYAFEASTGDILWQYYTSGGYPMRSSPTILDGRLFHGATFAYTLYVFALP